MLSSSAFYSCVGNKLRTYSMEQSPSGEANWFSACQEIPCIFWNLKVQYRINKCPPVPDQSSPCSLFPFMKISKMTITKVESLILYERSLSPSSAVHMNASSSLHYVVFELYGTPCLIYKGFKQLQIILAKI
jgi:hypothetical protein